MAPFCAQRADLTCEFRSIPSEQAYLRNGVCPLVNEGSLAANGMDHAETLLPSQARWLADVHDLTEASMARSGLSSFLALPVLCAEPSKDELVRRRIWQIAGACRR